jgi:hypothetical protein
MGKFLSMFATMIRHGWHIGAVLVKDIYGSISFGNVYIGYAVDGIWCRWLWITGKLFENNPQADNWKNPQQFYKLCNLDGLS